MAKITAAMFLLYSDSYTDLVESFTRIFSVGATQVWYLRLVSLLSRGVFVS